LIDDACFSVACFSVFTSSVVVDLGFGFVVVVVFSVVEVVVFVGVGSLY